VDLQLKQADLGPFQSVLVRKILHILEPVIEPGDLEGLAATFGIVVSLFKGHTLDTEDDEEQWVNAVPGDISNRDRVRVRPDAYTGRLGVLHNGKIGRVATLRNGKAAVVYDGASIEVPPQHEISALQKLV
jgi:hypothetical protein